MAKSKTDSPVGGITFFISLIFLLFISVNNLIFLPGLVNFAALATLGILILGFILGCFSASFLIRGHASVFLHELKHRIVSNLVGNKEKDLVVKKNSGHFEYEFSQKTAHYNAIISLAPYCLPLFSLPLLLIALVFFHTNMNLVVVCLGLGMGIDFILNKRDISPYQTDISSIRGGYRIGLTYIFAMNCAWSTFLLAWIIKGNSGLLHLLSGIIKILKIIVFNIYNR